MHAQVASRSTRDLHLLRAILRDGSSRGPVTPCWGRSLSCACQQISRAIACAAVCSVGCWPAVLRLHVRQQQQQQQQQMQQPPRPPPSCRSTGRRTRRRPRPALAARTSTTSTTRWKRRSSWRQWWSRRTARARTPAGALSLQGRRYDYIQSCVHDHHDCVLLVHLFYSARQSC